MKRQHIKEHGFAVVEGLLVVILMAIISFTGYYVWRSSSQSNQTLKSAQSVSGNAPIPVKNPTQAKHLFSIYQWGVKGAYIGDLNPKYVIIENNDHQTAYFYADDLAGKDPACNIKFAAGGLLDKYATIDRYAAGVSAEFKPGVKETVEKYVASGAASTYVHAGKYYYIASKAKSPCSASVAAQKLQAQIYTDVASITKSLTTYCGVQVPVCEQYTVPSSR